MPTLRGAVLAVCTVLFCATLAPGARADQWDKKTIVTFGDAVEIPGQVLSAGTYVFKLADTLADRHIVQIWNADETQIFQTIRTIPNTRFEPPDKTIFEFDELGRFAHGSQSVVLSGRQHRTGIHLFPLFLQPLGETCSTVESGNSRFGASLAAGLPANRGGSRAVFLSRSNAPQQSRPDGNRSAPGSALGGAKWQVQDLPLAKSPRVCYSMWRKIVHLETGR